MGARMSFANFLPNAGASLFPLKPKKTKFVVAKVHEREKIKILTLYMDFQYLDQHFLKSIEGQVYYEGRLEKSFDGVKQGLFHTWVKMVN